MLDNRINMDFCEQIATNLIARREVNFMNYIILLVYNQKLTSGGL